ncbi:MarR family winged helix-turn-helix transcriptional regulator [Frankia sp. Cr1]|uniref:MarR family winged helix-turn-helix transcriptional regulator n=1 Tax=Frankia sp. Cr1 TaxID=3073931 RepID=UPI002AD36A40|nr:MarR family transcriptional regulator [Frankia sp. Cr1]
MKPQTGDEIIDTLLAVSHRLRHRVNDTLQVTAGLTLSRFKVLQLVERRGPSRLRDIADATDVTARTMTETVDWLEGEGLVIRTAHPTDRRALLVALTDAGRARLTAADRHRTAEVGAMTRHLSTAQREEFLQLLRSVLDAIEGTAADIGPDGPDGPDGPPETVAGNGCS